MGNDEYVVDIACGALFTVVLTNQGRVLACGVIGTLAISTLEDQLDKTKFREISFDTSIAAISAGLSGAAAISNDGVGYFWGKFGKTVVNVPRRV
jgi:alpha-tubulin suppressor-like RCC1 family protein